MQLCKKNADGVHNSAIPLGTEDYVSFDTHEYDGNIYITYEEYDEDTR